MIPRNSLLPWNHVIEFTLISWYFSYRTVNLYNPQLRINVKKNYLGVSFHRNICNVSLVYLWTDLLSTKIRQQQTVSFCNNSTLPFLTSLWKMINITVAHGLAWHEDKQKLHSLLFFVGKRVLSPSFFIISDYQFIVAWK